MLARSLDRENEPSHSFMATVTDAGGLSSQIPLTLTVTDVNDNRPVFAEMVQLASVAENAINAFVAAVTATDADARGPNSNLEYRIIGGNTLSNFAIDLNAGTIFTAKPLDREVQANHVLQVVANDQGSPSLTSATAVVQITVADRNDHPPTVEDVVYSVPPGRVSENALPGLVVATVVGADLDVDDRILYTAVAGDLQSLNVTSTGAVVVGGPIDRETTASLTLTVSVSNGDGVQPSASTVVTLTVTDLNDVPPIFVGSPFSVQVFEDIVVGSKVVTLMAVDGDMDASNRVMSFAINATDRATTLFRIPNSSDGIITVARSLDYEQQREHRFGVTVVDDGGWWLMWLFCRTYCPAT